MSRPLLELDHEHQEPDKARDNASLQLDRAILKLAGVLGRLRVVRPQDRARDGRRVRCRPQVPCPAVAAFRVRAELRFSPDLRLSTAPASSTPEHRGSNSMPRESAARGAPLQTLASWPRDPAVDSRSPKTGRIRTPVARPRPPRQLVMPPEASSSRLALPPFAAVVPQASSTPASASSRRTKLLLPASSVTGGKPPARIDRIDQAPAPRPRARSASPRERQRPRPSSPPASWTSVFDQLG